jgi:hypothetical protein
MTRRDTPRRKRRGETGARRLWVKVKVRVWVVWVRVRVWIVRVRVWIVLVWMGD